MQHTKESLCRVHHTEKFVGRGTQGFPGNQWLPWVSNWEPRDPWAPGSLGFQSGTQGSWLPWEDNWEYRDPILGTFQAIFGNQLGTIFWESIGNQAYFGHFSSLYRDHILGTIGNIGILFWAILALFGLVPGFLRDPIGFAGILAPWGPAKGNIRGYTVVFWGILGVVLKMLL